MNVSIRCSNLARRPHQVPMSVARPRRVFPMHHHAVVTLTFMEVGTCTGGPYMYGGSIHAAGYGGVRRCTAVYGGVRRCTAGLCEPVCVLFCVCVRVG